MADRNRLVAWKQVVCQAALCGGRFVVFTLTYSNELIQRIRLQIGGFLRLDLPEVDFSGETRIIGMQDMSVPAGHEGELLVAMERQHIGEFGVMVYGKGELAQKIMDRRRALCREIILAIEKPDGGRVDITLIRFIEWLESHRAQVGKEIFLDLPEMGVRGFARVLAINPCPPMEPPGTGPHRTQLVTGTFRHTSGRVYNLKLESEAEPLVVTATHPFWSVDRQEYVSAASLQLGETLKTLEGTTVVESITKRDEPEIVYTLKWRRIIATGWVGVECWCIMHRRTEMWRVAPQPKSNRITYSLLDFAHH